MTVPRLPVIVDTDDAADYVEALKGLLHLSGWTHTQRATLTRRLRVWERRAAGLDARWNLVGSRGGRLPRELESRVKGHE